MSEEASTAVGAVFQGLLEAALRDAAAGAFEDEAEDEGTGVTSCVQSHALSKLVAVARSFLAKFSWQTSSGHTAFGGI